MRHMIFHKPTRAIWFATDAGTLGRATLTDPTDARTLWRITVKEPVTSIRHRMLLDNGQPGS